MSSALAAVRTDFCWLLAAMLSAWLLTSCGGNLGAGSQAMDTESAQEPAATAFSSYTAEDADSLLNGNRDAVDGLTASVASVLPPGTGVLVASFVNAGDLDETTSLGRLLAAQFATGLTDAAFLVKESRLRADLALRQGQGEFVLSRQAAALANQAFDVSAILYGFYIEDQDAVYVSARVALAEDASVIASEDYALLNRRAVSRMLKNSHDTLFERFVRKPVAGQQDNADQAGLVERDLAAEPPGEPEPVFRIFPPARLNP